MNPAEAAHRHYPPSLEAKEQELIRARRVANGEDPDPPGDPRVGIALSGGGIRSATLSLGFFQALAEKLLLRRVDYLSTVSGGGSLGGFLGAWFTRSGNPPGPDAVQEELARGGAPVRWLRNNSNYLAPNGSGDAVLAVGIILRNWASMLVVMGMALLVVLLAARGVACLIGHPAAHAIQIGAFTFTPLLGLVVPVLLLAAGVGWAYWLVPGKKGEFTRQFAWIAVVVAIAGVAAIAAAGLFLEEAGRQVDLIVTGSVVLVAALTAVVAATWIKYQPVPHRGNRLRASLWLRNLLNVAGILLFLGLVDSIGRMAYGSMVTGNWGWIAALVSAVTVIAGFARKITSKARGPGEAPRKTSALTEAIAIPVAAVLVVLLMGAIVSAVSHAATWCGSVAPVYVPRAPAPETVAQPTWSIVVIGLVVGFALSWFWRKDWPFVNRSSYHRFYHARLTRAFLGASNPVRSNRGPAGSVTQLHREDDVPMSAYRPHEFGGPLHLVNVTINETIEGSTQLQRLHRKGVGMAIGPAGISVGARHHANWTDDRKALVPLTEPNELPPGHMVFAPTKTVYDAEDLSLGQWVAISGAAASTGMGSRTTIAKSLLCGLFNVRLGYWWDSGVERGQAWLSQAQDLVQVQRSFLNEYLARFPGTARRNWYLSDGGHFENLATYELIRRRLPLIFVCDFEQDTEYRFSGLGNLVRKARIDFGSEIDFLEAEDLDEVLHEEVRPLFGTLEELRPRPPEAGSAEFPRSRAAFALARVRHADGSGSWLIYIKPVLLGDEPGDVLQYRAAHPDFPQQSTADQFFDEAQWESYRALGASLGGKLFGEARKRAGPAGTPLEWIQRGRGPDPAPRPKRTAAKKKTAKKAAPKKSPPKKKKKGR